MEQHPKKQKIQSYLFIENEAHKMQGMAQALTDTIKNFSPKELFSVILVCKCWNKVFDVEYVWRNCFMEGMENIKIRRRVITDSIAQYYHQYDVYRYENCLDQFDLGDPVVENSYSDCLKLITKSVNFGFEESKEYLAERYHSIFGLDIRSHIPIPGKDYVEPHDPYYLYPYKENKSYKELAKAIANADIWLEVILSYYCENICESTPLIKNIGITLVDALKQSVNNIRDAQLIITCLECIFLGISISRQVLSEEFVKNGGSEEIVNTIINALNHDGSLFSKLEYLFPVIEIYDFDNLGRAYEHIVDTYPYVIKWAIRGASFVLLPEFIHNRWTNIARYEIDGDDSTIPDNIQILRGIRKLAFRGTVKQIEPDCIFMMESILRDHIRNIIIVADQNKENEESDEITMYDMVQAIDTPDVYQGTYCTIKRNAKLVVGTNSDNDDTYEYPNEEDDSMEIEQTDSGESIIMEELENPFNNTTNNGPGVIDIDYDIERSIATEYLRGLDSEALKNAPDLYGQMLHISKITYEEIFGEADSSIPLHDQPFVEHSIFCSDEISICFDGHDKVSGTTIYESMTGTGDENYRENIVRKEYMKYYGVDYVSESPEYIVPENDINKIRYRKLLRDRSEHTIQMHGTQNVENTIVLKN
eukprot:TRINITY_DN5453_c2_g1_i6.p1 TRINITY_DN5453_c2_g1~~TRINITY_DN5453_c2_g1_i6.p1  ORF type:complete len:647 (-),score=143.43 TRINITY_DN5453_c2_g1_i6:979-2919(-)